MIIVYTKPACQACKATYRYLDKAGVEYEIKDVTEDEAAYAAVVALGYEAMPVVVAGDDHWSGLKVDRINALAAPVV